MDREREIPEGERYLCSLQTHCLVRHPSTSTHSAISWNLPLCGKNNVALLGREFAMKFTLSGLHLTNKLDHSHAGYPL